MARIFDKLIYEHVVELANGLFNRFFCICCSQGLSYFFINKHSFAVKHRANSAKYKQFLLLSLSLTFSQAVQPTDYVENFTDQILMDAAKTQINWSTAEGKAYLAWSKQRRHYLPSASTSASADIGNEADTTFAFAATDVDGDGDSDLVAGEYDQTNKLYLNDGAGGFSTTGTNIGSETDNIRGIVFVDVDVDGDGDADLIVGNSNQTNKLYHQ